MRKVILIALLAMIASQACQAQGLIESLYKKSVSTTANIVSDAVMNELCIVRQQYRLARDGKTYGKNNKPYYGETYSLGIKVSNGMIISNSVLEPWKDDPDFNRLNSSNQYKPELFWSYQRELKDTNFKEVDFEFGTDYIHPLDTGKQLFIHDEKKGDFGLSIDNTPGEKVGYMIWVYTNTNLQDSAMVVSIKQTSMKIVASEDSAKISLDENDSEKILGGFYVAPKYERGGRIQLQLIGVAVPSNNGQKWELSLLTKGSAEKKTTNPTSSEVKREDNGSAEPTPIETEKDKSDNKGKKKKK